ncbi:AsmA-like C-terminal region-containing protein [uncultured Bacteroides sp.]|uniref:AsmA family protein n=1 Tax=uncultured Bacteroides sp. TaxID=162156 RepID=UPI002AA7FCEA|nr:AsmA-like C-terminal region-containing protein [uncultured Bacteroides sp.]
MKKGLKITAIVLGIILLLMFILPFAFRGKIEKTVKSEGNKMLNAQFDFASLDISLFKNFPRASITLNDFWLKGVNEFKNDTLVHAGKVTAAINLFSLFGSNGYSVSKISVEDTQIHAIVLANGKVNWDIMKPDSTAQATSTAEESPFKMNMKKMTTQNMTIIYDDRQANMYAEINNLNGSCSGDLGSDRTTLKVEAETQSLTFKMDGIPFLNKANVQAKMDIDADLVNSKYTFSKSEVNLNAIKAGIDGWVAMRDPAIDIDLKLNTSEVGFKEILSLVPAIYAKEFESIKTEGKATLTAYAKGTLQGDTVPQFDATLDVKNAMFRYPSLPAGVDQINIHANAKNPGGSADLTEITVSPFSFRLAGNPFSITASVKTPISDPDFKAEAKGTLNLGMIKQVYPLENMELNGTVVANMQMAGRLSYAEKEQYDKFHAAGTIALANMKLKVKDMPDVEIKKSLLTFTPKDLQLSETTVNIGKNDITADSRFENYMGYALKDKTLKGTLNIRSNHFNLNDFMTVDSTTTATTAAETGIVEVPKNIDFQMDANMKEVLFDKMTFTNMNGKLTVKDGKADMKNLSMSTMGGNVVMNGYYSTQEVEKPKMNADFRMTNINFAQAYKELDMVQKMAPVFENLKGNFSGNISVLSDIDKTMSPIPILNTMQGKGSLSTKDLNLSDIKTIDMIAEAVKKPSLKEMKVKDLTIDFTIKDGRVATKPFDIKMGEYNMNLSGTTGLDQTIDYSGKVKLPASAGSLSQLSTLDLKIGGTFNSPKVSIDTKSMASQAAETVKNKAIEKLGKKLGLDSATTASTDSLKKKVTEKATEKIMDFLKKKIK